MTLTELFNTIRPQCESAFWNAWTRLGYEVNDLTQRPSDVTAEKWQAHKAQAFAEMERKQLELYKLHGIETLSQ